MSSKRRKEYLPIAKFPVYNSAYDKARMQSEILTPNPVPSMHTIFWDKNSLKAELIKMLGNYKPALQEKLADLEFKFQNLKTECRNQGREIPTEMPDKLLNEKYKVEARIDVLTEEVELLSEKLKTIADKVVKQVNENLLRYGLICTSKNHGLNQPNDLLINVMKEIDGQNVSMCPEGLLIIDDEASPYHQMSLPDYRKLSKIWHADRLKADEELLKKMQAEAKEKGEERPYSTGTGFGRQVSKSDLPKFPEDWKRYSMTIIEDDEEVTYKRKAKYKNSRAV